MEYKRNDGSIISFTTILEDKDNASIFHHFKGINYKIITIGVHSETREPYVVYEAQDDYHHAVRLAEMFFSKMDRDKYPDIEQEYRFQIKEAN